MSDLAAKRAALRASLAPLAKGGADRRVRVPLGHPAADRVLQGGLCRGAFHEIFAAPGHEAAATGFAAALIARIAAQKPLLWIEQDFAACEYGALAPAGFLEWGLDPARLFLLKAHDAADALRAAFDALSCAALGAVVIELAGAAKAFDMAASRRLTLASAQKGVTVFLLRFAAKPLPSTAETRWLIRAAAARAKKENGGIPAFDATLLRNRQGEGGQWIMEWCCDDGYFRAPNENRNDEIRNDQNTAHPRAVVPAPRDRSLAAQGRCCIA
jgi:protein ImuA